MYTTYSEEEGACSSPIFMSDDAILLFLMKRERERNMKLCAPRMRCVQKVPLELLHAFSVCSHKCSTKSSEAAKKCGPHGVGVEKDGSRCCCCFVFFSGRVGGSRSELQFCASSGSSSVLTDEMLVTHPGLRSESILFCCLCACVSSPHDKVFSSALILTSPTAAERTGEEKCVYKAPMTLISSSCWN